MLQILTDLYYGNIRPGEAAFARDSEYAIKLRELVRYQNELNGLLGEDEKILFTSFCEAQSELNGMTAANNFVYGFRLGAQLIIAIMTENGLDSQ